MSDAIPADTLITLTDDTEKNFTVTSTVVE